MRWIALILCTGFSGHLLAASTDAQNLDKDQRAQWFAQDRTYKPPHKGVVKDMGSGLRWQHQVSNSQLNWAEAKKYCAALHLANIDSWRLPSRLELLSLLNYDNPTHAYDSSYFDGEPTVAFWSGTVYDNMPSHVWIAQFGEGDMYCLMRVAQAHVRCVA